MLERAERQSQPSNVYLLGRYKHERARHTSHKFAKVHQSTQTIPKPIDVPQPVVLDSDRVFLESLDEASLERERREREFRRNLSNGTAILGVVVLFGAAFASRSPEYSTTTARILEVIGGGSGFIMTLGGALKATAFNQGLATARNVFNSRRPQNPSSALQMA